MVQITSFEQFFEEADKLYTSAPAYTRFSVKYRHCDGKAVFKVTNDVLTITFTTDQQSDLRKLEKLNGYFFARMTGCDPAENEAEAQPEPSKPRSGKSRKR